MFKAAIFDLDGTLFDSMSLWLKIDREFLHRRGITLTDDYSKAISSMEINATAKYTIERYNLKESAESIIDEWHEMACDEYKNNIDLKDGVKEYLEYLEKNNVKMAIATSSSPKMIIPCLEKHDILKYFKFIRTSSDVKVGKISPKIYESAVEELGEMPHDCCVFEDLYIGLKSAKSVGFQTIGVLDSFSKSEESLVRAYSDRVISSFRELL